jgi:hypothetical protein
MAEKKPGRPKKAQVDINIACPHCQKRMNVQVFRDIVTPAVPAEVELRPIVTPDNQEVFDFEETKNENVEVEPEKKKKTKKKAGKKKGK